MEKKKKVLFIYDNLLHYRVPLFNLLGDKYDFTVIHSGKKMTNSENFRFREIIVKKNKIGPFTIRLGSLKFIFFKEYDAILYNLDIRWVLELVPLFLKYKSKKVIIWGAWFTDSIIANQIRLFFCKKYKSLYYCNTTRNEFVQKGVNIEKTFVANNTVEILSREKSFKYEKEYILVIGSLNKRKKNDILIKAFSKVIKDIPQEINLIFIGKGAESNYLKKLTFELNMLDRIKFLGEIIDHNLIKDYYKKSIISVSYGQAGLSVLQSFGFGVPYLTTKNAISGGEIYNIIDGYNGFLIDSKQKYLELILKKICIDKSLATNLGKNAYNYYSEFCTMDNMVQGFVDAIENTRKSNIDLINHYE
ncbi:glycosyltransferase [Mesoflavibacter zeaxanthinifaciens]|uniref:glycosyltransferase n=1 Tax=Mesoflavibacter zeaxanthinifaciens TaxID=393060 RepID=UPI003A91C6F1